MFLTRCTLRGFRKWALVPFFVMLSGPVWAQDSPQAIRPPSDWATITALVPGSDLRIELSSGKRAIGSLVSATADGMTLSVKRGDMSVSREMIQRVVLLGDRLTARDAKRGFIIGAGAGGLMGTLGTKSNRVTWGAFLGGTWGALGAAIGAINGSSRHEESVVYVAQGANR